MATVLHAEQQFNTAQPLDKDFSCVIISAEWNRDITDALTKGAVSTFRNIGIKEENIKVEHVPGTIELSYAAKVAMDTLRPSAIIIIGCVIRGDTAHFDYVCQSVTQGMTLLNTIGDIPVIFGVLTVDTMQQALDRAGGYLGNKGAEAANVAIEMANLKYRMTH